MHVWLHNEVDFDVQIDYARFDFADSDSQLALDDVFTFDYSSLDQPHGYDDGTPFLPVPVTWNGWLINCYPCPTIFFVVPEGGSFHIGSIGIMLPEGPGSYRVDLLNADEAESGRGAKFGLQTADKCPIWSAYTGEINGGLYVFRVSGPIPALSPWGGAALVLTLIIAGSFAVFRAGRRF